MNVYVWNRLPSTYQEVEYIQSSWTQYINTWLAGTAVNCVELSFLFPSLPPSDVVNAVWARENGTAISPVRVDTSSKMIPRFWSWVTTNTTLTANTQYTVKTQYTSWSQTVYVNGTQVGTASITWTRSNKYNIFLFWLNNNGSLGNSWTIRVFSCKMYSWTTLLRDFVPCYRKSDSVIWLYDLVNSAFYTNAWSWTFSKWSDVLTNAELKNAYIGEVWSPWSNTIAYFPFVSDTLDHSWNWTSLSINNCTFVKDTSNVTGYKFTYWSSWDSNIYFINSNVQFLCFWFKINSINSWYNSTLWYIRSHWISYWPAHYESDIRNKIVVFTNSSYTRWAITDWFTYNAWHNIALWYDGTKLKVGKDWVLSDFYTGSWYNFGDNKIFIVWSSNSAQQITTVSEVIAESACWSASDYLNYYNLTKSNYWL